MLIFWYKMLKCNKGEYYESRKNMKIDTRKEKRKRFDARTIIE